MSENSKVKFEIGHEPLETEVKDGKLTVSIGVYTLAFASLKENGGPVSGFRVITGLEDLWACDVAAALDRESEKGSSKITRALDAAMTEAMDSGSQALS